MSTWTASEREKLLIRALEFAYCIDIEVASIPGMKAVIGATLLADIPWIASFHDFSGFPGDDVITAAAQQARQAGAAVFKMAVTLKSPSDLARLADIQLRDFGIPLATMGMGPLAAVSRLLCAQCGSVLNYGFLGATPTAPGQWDAATLRMAVDGLPEWR